MTRHRQVPQSLSAPAADQGKQILIWAASTNVGIHSIQLSKILAPHRPIYAVASASHHDFLRSLGADRMYDYHDTGVEATIFDASAGSIKSAIDGISEGDSTKRVAACMANVENDQQKGHIVRMLPPRGVPANVTADWIVSYTVLGEPFTFLFKSYPAMPDDRRMGSNVFKSLPKWIEGLSAVLGIDSDTHGCL